jgi:hypothetical protein
VISRLYRSHVSGAGPSGFSTINSRFIQIYLNLETGIMSGRVLAGEFKDRLLDEMSRSEIDQLADICRLQDAESFRLLASYISARFGGQAGPGSDGRDRSGIRTEPTMTIDEALRVLGLKGTPTKEEITSAYRKIMQQIHPDRGGNEYFAAKVNQARDMLNSRFG